MLINCDPFHSFFFLASAIYSEDAVQKLAAELCENHKTLVTEFFFKKLQNTTQLRKELSKVLFREICKVFQSRFFLEPISVNAFISGVALVEPHQKDKYFRSRHSAASRNHIRHGGSPVNLPYIFRAPFNTKNTSGRLLLVFDSLNK